MINIFIEQMSFKLIFPIICIMLCLSPILSVRLLAETTDSKVLNTQVYVQEQNKDYYQYKIYSSEGDILAEISDSQLKTYELKFSKKDNNSNTLVYRTAYNKYIIVEEKNSTGNSVSYWVLEIVHNQNGFSLQSFAVKSRVDNQGFEMNDDYILTQVLEYDPKQEVLYVKLVTSTDEDVYGIDVKNKSDVLKIINWFFYQKEVKQRIVGGNFRVLVDAATDRFMFDTQNKRANNSDPTIYDRVNISEFTTLPIYPGGSRVYNFIGSYFQYVSLSQDGKNMTTFIWKGYDKNFTVLNQDSLNSSSEIIKFFSDQQTFFVSVADNDAYAIALRWDDEKQDYVIQEYTLSTYAKDEDQRKVYLENFKSALLFTYFNGRFFVLTADSFAVYGDNQYFMKMLDQPVKQGDDLYKTIMTEMKNYLETKM